MSVYNIEVKNIEEFKHIFKEIKVISGKEVIAGSKGEWRMSLIIGKDGILSGSRIRIGVPLMWTFPQVSDPCSPGYTHIFTSSNTAFISEIKNYRYIYITIKEPGLKEGDEIEVIYSGIAQWVAYEDEKLEEFEVSYSPFQSSKFIKINLPSNKLKITCGEPALISVYIPSITIIGEEYLLKVVIKDKYGNPVLNYEDSIFFECTDKKAILPKRYRFKISDRGRGVFKIVFNTPGIHTITVRNSSNSLIGVSNPTKCDNSAQFNLYWGDIHGHTTISDGATPIDFYYRTARDVTGFDFSAVTDHGYQGPHKFYDNEVSIEITDKEWDLIRQKAKKYYEPGKFVTFSAYEWTGVRGGRAKSKEDYGDKNVYYLTDDQPIFRRNSKGSETAPELWNKLRSLNTEVITIPHHTASGWVSLGWDWHCHDEKLEPLVEIYSVHGTSEYSGNPRPIIKELKEGFVQNALAKGYKLGFIGGSDSHSLHLNCDRPSGLPYLTLRYRGGITGIYAKELTRKGLFEAMKARRVYATTGERIIIDFKIDTHMMGEEYVATKPPFIYGEVVGTSKLKKIEVIKNNDVIYILQGKDKRAKFEFTDFSIAKGTNYYYLRVIQEDEEMGWSSPIWVNYIS